MNIKYIFFICFNIIFVSNETLMAMKKSLSKIQPLKFKELMNYSSDFLRNNEHRLACQKNESGFIRINIPIVSSVKSQFQGIKKLRLNYWSPETGVIIRPESIHTHPSYFESLILQGGYTHELYEQGEGKDQEYDLYRILKDSDKKSFIFIGQSKLKFLRKESISKDSLAVFDKDLIHRVLHTIPKTLSLNAVFDDSSEEDASSYNIYLTQYGTLHDIKTTRDVLLRHQSKQFINEILSIIAERKSNIS